MNRFLKILFVVSLIRVVCGSAAPEPARFGVLPSERQIAWQEMGLYAFVHFTINTFTDKEWGYGDESPELFNPTDFDADALVAVVKDAGLRGLVLTAKHHDGFCLWPSAYTDHDIAASPFREGKGDLVREVSDACRRAGIQFGIYLSPWDRNHKAYGKPEYITYYRNQLRELLSNYGPIFEIWFDGANGGDGWYGGADELRTIDRTSYYDWENTWRIVRELQPQAVIFSDAGPDCRWIGNEEGYAPETSWATINADHYQPGNANVEQLMRGDRYGSSWIPGEVDVSIRPGWFYHASEDDDVKSSERLFEIYLDSLGRGSNLILNIAPDRRGRVPDIDRDSLLGWKRLRDATFAENLVLRGDIAVSETRGNAPRYSAFNLLDGDRSTYWATGDDSLTGTIVVSFAEPQRFNLVSIKEQIAFGQRIGGLTVEYWDRDAEEWSVFGTATSIGSERLVPGSTVTSTKVRWRITDSAACPVVSDIGIYYSPIRLDERAKH